MTLRHYVCSARRRKSRRCPGMSFVVRSLQARGITLSWFQWYGWKANIPQACQLVMTFRDFYSFRRRPGLKSEVVDDVHVPFVLSGKKKSVKSCVIYLTKNFGTRSRSRFCADRAQNLSGNTCQLFEYLAIAPDNILGVPQISSKSVHFLWSYSRTREHLSNAP